MRTDWSNPAARLALIERVGADEYNRLLQAEWARNTVTTVNGYPIRKVVDPRWGPLFMVVGADRAFATQPDAEAYARAHGPAACACGATLDDDQARQRGFCTPCWYGKEPT